MASVMKFDLSASSAIIRHVARQIQVPGNKNIDTRKTHLNYSLLPSQDLDPYDVLLQRKEEVYVYRRSNVKVLVGWVVFLPDDLPPGQETIFFEAVHQFLVERYSLKNTILSMVHLDEPRPHLHFLFVPIVPDPKHPKSDGTPGEKICAAKVLTPHELRNFHPALQRHLTSQGINCHIYSKSCVTPNLADCNPTIKNNTHKIGGFQW